jgi:hypothetical protein
MVIEQIRPHQMIEQVHDYRHYEHSPPSVGLLFMVFFDEWLQMLLVFYAQLVLRIQVQLVRFH